jgi:histone H3/H4
MPFQRCQKDGKTGIRWGEHGTCYTGKDAKKKADLQRKAIEMSKHSKSKEITHADIQSFLEDLRKGNKDGECCC